MKGQRGFTLIEIAIVLVIIGLLLGGVLKGQEMIVNGRVKNLINEFNGVTAAAASYQDRYRALPGDDNAAVSHVGATNNGNGNGIIGGNWNSNAANDESNLFWNHLRLAGLVSTNRNAGGLELRNHALGARVGVTGNQALYNIDGTNRVVVSGVEGRLAQLIDTNIDDGFADNGSIYGENWASNGSAAYNPVTTYNLANRL